MRKNLVGTICALGFMMLAGCGGGEDSGGGTAPPPPPPPSGIGAAGGTVTNDAAKVVVPAGALTTNVDIQIARTSVSAPALPAGVTPAGDTFAFTPHGTVFAKPVNMTVPFDPAKVPAGAVLVLYKTNATNTAWEVVHGATQSGSTLSVDVSGFSSAFVAPQPTEGFPALTGKKWTFMARDFNGPPVAPIDTGTQTGGRLDRAHLVGDDHFVRPHWLTEPKAKLEVFSNETGKSFFTESLSPQSPRDNPINSTSSALLQTYTFMVRDPSATLDFVISNAEVEVFDDGGNRPSRQICTWLSPSLTDEQAAAECADLMMWAYNLVFLHARRIGSHDDFFTRSGSMIITGIAGSLQFATDAGGAQDIFSDSDFIIYREDDVFLSALMSVEKKISIPLSGLRVGELFNVTIDLSSYTRDLVQGESYSDAFLSDPVNFDAGVSLKFTGLEQMPVNHDPIPVAVPVPCASPDPAAGRFEFVAASFGAPEKAEGADIVVRRVGGNHGEVKVLLETVDGSAMSSSDFEAQQRVLRFGDGESGKMIVNISLVQDKVEEPDETVTLKLSSFAGCATAGATTNATLTIQDDDHVIAPPATFTLGGSVSGLAGQGLVLQTNLFDQAHPGANGEFSFTSSVNNGIAYTVSVVTQPSNPAQLCTVTNGSGTVAGANVTNILVACATPPPVGALDPGFGASGKVLEAGRAATAIALQSDGKLLTLAGMTVSRYDTGGALDAGFGTGGRVILLAEGAALDAARAVAVQSDGRIVVAGVTSPATSFNNKFFVQRLNTDGSLDAGFGSGGKVLTDFGPFTDDAKAVLLQPDGRILVAGIVTLGDLGHGNSDFGVVRYLPDGTLDASFGVGGVATKDLGGGSEFVNAAALQADGAIFVTGRVFTDDGSGKSDMAVVRFLSTGSSDTAFGTNGIVRIDFGEGGVVPLNFDGGDWDEPLDIVVQPDGKVVLAGYTGITNITLISRAALVRLTTAGVVDPTFGALGLATTTLLDRANGVALQADGRIVIAGGTTARDFGIVRLTSTGAADDSFDTDGAVNVDFLGAVDVANDVLIQPDGKIVAAGLARNGNASGLGLVRVSP